MEGTKAYLQSDLTLKSVSETLQTKQGTLSRVIIQATRANYYTYLNNFRLAEFKQLLVQEENKKFSLEGLAKQAGFGSKTTFYTFFKKVEGMTPKEYRKKLKNS